MILALIFKLILVIILVSILFGITGAFVLWRKCSYLGDGIAHASFLGIIIGSLSSIDMVFSVICVALCFALLVQFFSNSYDSNDIIGVISYSFLSFGIIIAGMSDEYLKVSDFFFGDILGVNNKDIIVIASLAIINIIITRIYYKKFLSITISRDIATALNGSKVKWYELYIVLNIAMVIGVTVKIIGTLLVPALLIIPGVISRNFASSPLMMMISNILVIMLSGFLSILASIFYDLPLSPLIILVNAVLFLLVNITMKVKSFN